jgi:hypothetical protein
MEAEGSQITRAEGGVIGMLARPISVAFAEQNFIKPDRESHYQFEYREN